MAGSAHLTPLLERQREETEAAILVGYFCLLVFFGSGVDLCKGRLVYGRIQKVHHGVGNWIRWIPCTGIKCGRSCETESKDIAQQTPRVSNSGEWQRYR